MKEKQNPGVSVRNLLKHLVFTVGMFYGVTICDRLKLLGNSVISTLLIDAYFHCGILQFRNVSVNEGNE